MLVKLAALIKQKTIPWTVLKRKENMAQSFTCVSCRVAFKDAEIQREHYKSEWHRYNLKRKIAELPPLTNEAFQERVNLQREKDQLNNKVVVFFCKICKKSFSSENAFRNHLNSKKHKDCFSENVEQGSEVSVETEDTQDNPSCYSSETGTTVVTEPNNDVNSFWFKKEITQKIDATEDDSDIEEVDSDEWESYCGDNPILSNSCLFCTHKSRNLVQNIKHMTISHSFFIPDIEYLTDLKGLVTYLGEKISQGHMCIWCNDRGKAFHSIEAARNHMVDKGHCKMLHEGEALLEYSDFYDYTSSYPDNVESENMDIDEEIPIIDGSDYQLVLPSGRVVGHRSLMTYYRQHLNPERSLTTFSQRNVHRVLKQYRALGWTETQKENVIRNVRDIRFMKRVQAKFNVQVGVKANKLHKKYGCSSSGY